MAEIQQFDLGRVLSQAEAIKGARQQNRLAELLTPYREREAMRSEQQAQTQVTDEAIQRTARLTGVFLDTIGDIENMPPEQQQQAWSGAMQKIQSLGAETRGLPMEYSPENLRWARGLGERLGVGHGGATVQSTYVNREGQRVAIMRDGSERILGQAEQNLRYVGDLGVFANQRTGSLVAPAGAAESPQAAMQMEQQRQIELERRKGAAQQEGKGASQSRREAANEGLIAADNMGPIVQAIGLLDRVQTGGWTNEMKLAVKQRFGAESADEGELSGLLGKSVLSQLRSTFGAAFTEREGARLENIEAGFGKSAETNKRLLNNAFSIMETAAERGIRAAKADGDDFLASEIQMKLDQIRQMRDQSTGPTNPPPPPNPAGQPTPMSQPARPGEVRRSGRFTISVEQ